MYRELGFGVGMRNRRREGEGILPVAEWVTDLSWGSQSGHRCSEGKQKDLRAEVWKK